VIHRFIVAHHTHYHRGKERVGKQWNVYPPYLTVKFEKLHSVVCAKLVVYKNLDNY
jgi:hypothetical protein